MSNACGHDLLDWVAAVGPTIATLAAVGATIWAGIVARRVSGDAIDFQRKLSAPRLTILERVRVDSPNLTLVVELRNEGQTPASIHALRVFAHNREIAPRSLEDPRTYWTNVLKAVGLMRFGSIEGNVRIPPSSIAGNATDLLFQVVLIDPEAHLRTVIGNLRLEIEYRSLWGEHFRIEHQFRAGT